MKIEHLAFITREPREVAAWYCQHIGFTVKRKLDRSPDTHFLADESGRVMVEIYNNPKVTLPDYWSMDPLVLHLAFSVEDVPAERKRLIGAGASPEGDAQITADGDTVAMLRDPWGFPVQLVKRAEPMVPQD
jgi:glyoxylase I family protein